MRIEMKNCENERSNAFFESTTYDKPHSMIWGVNYVPAHFHKHFEILLVMEGSLVMYVDGERRELSVGDGVYISPNVIHSYERNGECKRFITCFEPECMGTFGDIMLKYKPRHPFISSEQMHGLFDDPFKTVTELWIGYKRSKNGDTESLDYISYLSAHNKFVTSLLSVTGLAEAKQTGKNRYNEALRICCENFGDEKFNAPALAKAMNISESGVHKLFAKNMHMSVKHYIADLRITKACELLECTDMSISEIALHVGYGSIRTFNRVFSENMKTSPGEYRKSRKGDGR